MEYSCGSFIYCNPPRLIDILAVEFVGAAPNPAEYSDQIADDFGTTDGF